MQRENNLFIRVLEFSCSCTRCQVVDYEIPIKTDGSQVLIFAIVCCPSNCTGVAPQPFYTSLSLQIPYPHNLTTSTGTYIPRHLVTEAESRYRLLYKWFNPQKIKYLRLLGVNSFFQAFSVTPRHTISTSIIQLHYLNVVSTVSSGHRNSSQALPILMPQRYFLIISSTDHNQICKNHNPH